MLNGKNAATNFVDKLSLQISLSPAGYLNINIK